MVTEVRDEEQGAREGSNESQGEEKKKNTNGTTIFVGNLPFETQDDQLEKEFSEIGPIKRAFVVKDKDKRSRSRGCGYVQFVLQEDADRCAKANKTIGNRTLRLCYAAKKPKHAKRKALAKKEEEENMDTEDTEGKETIEVNKKAKIEKKNPMSDKAIKKTNNDTNETSETPQEVKSDGKTDIQKTIVLTGLKERVKRKAFRILCETFGEVDKIVYPVPDREAVTAFVRFKEYKSAIRATQKIPGKKVRKSGILSACLLTKENKYPSQKTLQQSRLIIRNLSFKCEDDDLREQFSKFGKVMNVNIPTKKVNEKDIKIGCAFVQFANSENAKVALDEMNLKEIKGRQVVVDWAISKEKYMEKNSSEGSTKTESKGKNENDKTRNGKKKENENNEKVLEKKKKKKVKENGEEDKTEIENNEETTQKRTKKMIKENEDGLEKNKKKNVKEGNEECTPSENKKLKNNEEAIQKKKKVKRNNDDVLETKTKKKMKENEEEGTSNGNKRSIENNNKTVQKKKKKKIKEGNDEVDTACKNKNKLTENNEDTIRKKKKVKENIAMEVESEEIKDSGNNSFSEDDDDEHLNTDDDSEEEEMAVDDSDDDGDDDDDDDDDDDSDDDSEDKSDGESIDEKPKRQLKDAKEDEHLNTDDDSEEEEMAGDDSDEVGDDDDDDDDDDDSDDDYEDKSDGESIDEKPKREMKDAKEGKTIFIRNLSYNVDEDIIKEEFEKYGEMDYCKLVYDHESGRSKGTAFIKFKEKESTDNCIKEFTEKEKQGVNIVIDGRPIMVSLAVTKGKLGEMEREKSESKKETDKRNIYLASEGIITKNSPAAEGLSDADLKKREKALAEKKAKLKNPNFFVSRTRLCVKNLPVATDANDLKIAFMKHVPRQMKIQELKIIRSKERRDISGIPRSLGYGFIELESHEDALTLLRATNNNPNVFGEKRRPIVEFSVENAKALKILELKKKRLESKTLSMSENNEETDIVKKEDKKTTKEKIYEKRVKRFARYKRKKENAKLLRNNDELNQNGSAISSKKNNEKMGKESRSKKRKEDTVVQTKENIVQPTSSRGFKTNLPSVFEEPMKRQRKVSKKKNESEEEKFNLMVKQYKQKLFGDVSQKSKKKNDNRWFE